MKSRILIVDDEPANLRVLQRLLGPLGHVLLEAAGGEEALAAIERSRPDLVLLDVNMPGLDGIGVLRRLRATESTRTPVVLLTGQTDRESRLRGFEAGADDFLEKPLDRALLLCRVRTLLSLKATSDELVKRSHAKTAFLANMSHEIRTPLNAILGYAQLMARDESISRKHHRAVETILSGGHHLLGLVNDVLEVAKIEAGHRAVALANVDLELLLDEVARMFELRAASKSLAFEVSRSPALPRHVLTDELKVRQILVNLLGNAVKFTARGGVTMRALTRTDPAAAGDRRLVIEVEDTGPGMDPADVSSLFEPFFQTRVGVEAQGGTGLGLALSLELARALGGTITVESQLGRGTCFRVDLPCTETKAPPAPARALAGSIVGLADVSSSPKILIADDSEGHAWVADLLSTIGFQVLQVTTRAETIAVVTEWEPDLILVDADLPDAGGNAVTRTLRGTKSARRVIIVAISGGSEEDRAGAADAGADGWLQKPLDEEQLLSEIGRHLRVEYRRGADRGALVALGSVEVGAMTAMLPADAVGALRGACNTADYERASEVIEGIAPEHPAAAGLLRGLLERFDYDAVVAALPGPAGGSAGFVGLASRASPAKEPG